MSEFIVGKKYKLTWHNNGMYILVLTAASIYILMILQPTMVLMYT